MGTCLASTTFCWLQMFLDLWQHNFNLCFCLHMAVFSLWICVSTPLLVRTPVIGFRSHPNPVWPHLNVTKFICKDSISKWRHILSFQVHINFGEILLGMAQYAIFKILSSTSLFPSTKWGQSFRCKAYRNIENGEVFFFYSCSDF